MKKTASVKHPAVSKHAANPARTESTLGTKKTSMPSSTAANLKKTAKPQTSEETDLCSKGNLIQMKWRVLEKMGAGCFGQVYSVREESTGRLAAMKVESALKGDKAQLPMEVQALKKFQGKLHATALFGSGSNGRINFVIMQKVGENLQSLRRSSPHELQRFSLSTSMRLWVQCLESIQELHSVNIVHRDIKPVRCFEQHNEQMSRRLMQLLCDLPNFAMGLCDEPNKNNVFLLDFGLARFFKDESGIIKPERSSAGFRGTDLSRKDDLISLFFMAAEFLKGTLPWRVARSPKEVQELKEKFSLSKLLDFPQMQSMGEYLISLKFEDEPDYRKLKKWLEEVMTLHSVDLSGLWDWEENFVSAPSSSSSSDTTTASVSEKTEDDKSI